MMAGWQAGKCARASVVAANRLAAALALLASLSAGPLAAQVGNDPSHSPFRDITTGQSITLWGGTFFGNTAAAGVGAQAGPMVGLRLRSALSGPIELMISTSYVQSKRTVIDATKPPATRVSGPIDYNFFLGDISVGLTLTGNKTWHGLAPYAALGMGFVAPTQTVTDPGGFTAGSGFSFVATFGVRARVSRSLMLQVEGRDNTIRYEWPLRYYNPIDSNGNPLPPVLSGSTPNTDVTHNFSLTAGLSYNFNF